MNLDRWSANPELLTNSPTAPLSSTTPPDRYDEPNEHDSENDGENDIRCGTQGRYDNSQRDSASMRSTTIPITVMVLRGELGANLLAPRQDPTGIRVDLT